jgi:hypothetical protein
MIVGAAVVLLYLGGFGPYTALMRNGRIGYDPDGNWLQDSYIALWNTISRTPLKPAMDRYMLMWDHLLAEGRGL